MYKCYFNGQVNVFQKSISIRPHECVILSVSSQQPVYIIHSILTPGIPQSPPPSTSDYESTWIAMTFTFLSGCHVLYWYKSDIQCTPSVPSTLFQSCQEPWQRVLPSSYLAAENVQSQPSLEQFM